MLIRREVTCFVCAAPQRIPQVHRPCASCGRFVCLLHRGARIIGMRQLGTKVTLCTRCLQ